MAQGLETHPGYGSEGARGRWRRYGKSASPILAEGYYRTQYIDHPLYPTYYYHTKRLATMESEPWQRVTPLDTSIGWTDGRATSHVQDKPKGGKFTIGPPSIWDQGP